MPFEYVHTQLKQLNEQNKARNGDLSILHSFLDAYACPLRVNSAQDSKTYS